MIRILAHTSILKTLMVVVITFITMLQKITWVLKNKRKVFNPYSVA